MNQIEKKIFPYLYSKTGPYLKLTVHKMHKHILEFNDWFGLEHERKGIKLLPLFSRLKADIYKCLIGRKKKARYKCLIGENKEAR